MLQDQGYQIRTASDGLEATVVATEFNPDLVILDMRMPKMSGSDACAVIRRSSDVPIIMFTSSNDEAEVRDAILKGATDFVLKSTGVSILTERVRFHLAKNSAPTRNPAARTAPAKAPVAASANIERPPEAPKRIRTTSLIIDPDEESRKVVRNVLARLNQNVIEVGTAAEAIAAFKKHGPDIVITEWTLPDMDAFSMLSKLKKGRNSKAAKTAGPAYKFIMSARISPEAHRKARFAGITSFLYKPLDSVKVESMIADCVRKTLRNLKRAASQAA